MNADAMVQKSFKHQHPELYQREPVEEPSIPGDLRVGAGPGDVAATTEIPEEPIGYPGAIALMSQTMMEAERLRAQQESSRDAR